MRTYRDGARHKRADNDLGETAPKREYDTAESSVVRPKMRHQLGTEREARAAPVIHAIPTRAAMSGARFLLFFTAAAFLAYFVEQTRRYISSPVSLRGTIETVVYLALVTFLTASASAYLLCRLGYLARVRRYRRAPRAVIDAVYDAATPSLTIIIPSFREETRVIRQTLLSAMLQEYPDLRIVLLIDDPPNPTTPHHKAVLEGARSLPGELMVAFEEPRLHAVVALEAFEASVSGEGLVGGEHLERAANAYERAACWLRRFAAEEDVLDHADALLINEVVIRLALDLESVTGALREARAARAEISTARLRQLFRRLTWIFDSNVSSFERKQYASLTAESSKAANLNSYIGLMGGRYREAETPGGRVLLPVRGGEYTLEVANPNYVLTLDADSILLPEYCLRLVAFMQQPENAEVGVTQTPYSAYRGAPTRLERLAGASTDLQHMTHQGLTRYGATFWVGANAVLRKAALDEMMTEEDYNGFTVRRYISDRTVVEDTESSLFLRLRGWQLVNVPERLSYSATPPDFGALCVQRERWANGGITMLPTLLKLARMPHMRSRRSIAELFLRLNYLASIAWASLGLSILLFYPFDQSLLSSLAVLTALPYFVAISSDLHRAGYRRSDVARMYGFNLMLLAVNGAGALKSVGQAIGGQKVAFARTPKIQSRTVAPLTFAVIPVVIIGWSSRMLFYDLLDHNYLHAAFAGSNALFTLYAMLSLYGVRNSVADVFINLRNWVYRPVRQEKRVGGVPDWVTVLYYGTSVAGDSRESAAVAGALAAMDTEHAGQKEILLASSHHLGIVRTDGDSSTVTQTHGRGLSGPREADRFAPPRDDEESLRTAEPRSRAVGED